MTPDFFNRDEEGYLVEPDDWTPEFSRQAARDEEIELTQMVWQSIYFIRDYYANHRIAPDVRHITGLIAERNDLSKKQAKQFLFDQFPYGYVKQACKISGMKRPRAWSTG